MPERTSDWLIVARYFDGGWKTDETEVTGVTYEQASFMQSSIARTFDKRYPNDVQWTVDIFGLKDGEKDGLGSYYQFFHGRTS